jgi:RecG-like helicase
VSNRNQIFKGTKEVEAEEIIAHSKQAGASEISGLHSGEVAEVQGVVRCVIHQPADATPQFKFEVYDGTGVLCVTFMGRSSIVGIDPGIEIRLQGRVTKDNKNLTMFNPKYTLIKEQS